MRLGLAAAAALLCFGGATGFAQPAPQTGATAAIPEWRKRLFAEAQAAGKANNFDLANQKFNELLRLAREKQDDGGMAEAFYGLGEISFERGLWAVSAGHWKSFLEIAEANSSTGDAAEALYKLSFIFSNLNDDRAAIAYGVRAADILRGSNQPDEGLVLMLLGQARQRERDFSGAADALRKASLVLHALKDKTDEAVALAALGPIYRWLGIDAEATKTAGAALALFEEDKDFRGQATTLFFLAGIARDSGRYDEALANTIGARDAIAKAPDRALQVTILYNISRLQAELGHVAEEIEALRSLLQIAGKEMESGEEVRQAKADLRRIYRTLGDEAEAARYDSPAGERVETKDGSRTIVEQAEWDRMVEGALRGGGAYEPEVCRSALEKARTEHSAFAEANALQCLGVSERRAGRYTAALDLLRQAISIYQRLHVDAGEAACSIHIGALRAALGEFQPAIDALNRALTIARTSHNQFSEAKALNVLGEMHAQWGSYRTAINALIEAMTIWEKLGNQRELASVYNNLGAVYSAGGQKQDAIVWYGKSRTISHNLNDGEGEAAAFGNIGSAYLALRQYEKSADSTNKALELAIQWKDGDGEATYRMNLGIVYRDQGRNEAALAEWETASKILEGIEKPDLRATLLLNRAETQTYTGRYQEALDLAQQASKLVSPMRSAKMEGYAFYMIGKCLLTLGREGEAVEAFHRSVAAWETVRATAGTDSFKTGVAAQSADIYGVTVVLHLHRKEAALGFEYMERARARTFLDQVHGVRPPALARKDSELSARAESLLKRISELERQTGGTEEQRLATASEIAARRRDYALLMPMIQAQNPALAGALPSSTLSLAEVQRRLDADTTLLVYFFALNQKFVGVLTSSTYRFVPLEFSDEELQNSIDVFWDFPDLSLRPAIAGKLYNMLLAPVQKVVTTKRIGIVPFAALHYIPFGALFDGQRYFGEGRSLFYLPSASMIPDLRASRRASLLAGYSDLLAFSASTVPPLLRYADEAASESAKLFQGKTLLREAATVEQVREMLPHSKSVLLIGHGEMLPESPLFSRIHLADGPLEVRDVYTMNLQQTDLVFLSGCETHRGEGSRGDDIVGLSRAFLAAGARTVIATLWSVDEQATTRLITRFYHHLHDGLAKAAALSAAQLDIRSDPSYSHPYYWAAFILTGDPGSR